MRRGRLWTGVALLVGATTVVAGQLRRERLAREAADWPTAEATIDSTWVEEVYVGNPDMGLDLRYYPLARLSFVVDGVRYETTTEVEGLGSPYVIDVRLPTGWPTPIRFDPQDPERVYLDTGDVALVYTDLRPLCVVMSVVGLGLILSSGVVRARAGGGPASSGSPTRRHGR